MPFANLGLQEASKAMQQMLAAEIEGVATGQAEDWADYRRRVGLIHAYRVAIQECLKADGQ